jgi:hypothetical protein
MVFQKNPNITREEVIWNKKTYRRYPNAKQSSHRRYFSCAGSFLHRDVWREKHGEIPKGFHVHHKDGDPANNDILNLECVSGKDHFVLHKETRSTNSKRPEHLALLERIRPMTVDWHKSDEGRAWHRENAKLSLVKARQAIRFSKKPDLHRNCEVCGEAFTTRNTRKTICGTACQSKKSKSKKRRALAKQGNSGNTPLYPV